MQITIYPEPGEKRDYFGTYTLHLFYGSEASTVGISINTKLGLMSILNTHSG
jgi:hypothetical protein